MMSHSEIQMMNGNQCHTGCDNSTSVVTYDCSVCSSPICNQFVFRINENYFHAFCLNCSECHIKLFDDCYARNGNVYCKEHFFKKFGTKCASCKYGISSMEVVRRANGFVYHLQCFACLLCHRQLKTGDEFYLIEEQKLVCKSDFQALRNKDFIDTSKRPRTTINQKQLEILKQVYNTSIKPARHLRQSLAAQTGLDMRVVQVWFQNRRAKEKRLRKDPNRRTTNVTRTRGSNKRKTKKDFIQQEEDSSNEGNAIVSDHEISKDDSDDSLSQTHHTNSIYSDVHPPSNEFASFHSPYTELKGLMVISSYPKISRLLPAHSISPSSSTITITDEHESSTELDNAREIDAHVALRQHPINERH